jgi:hypothetical protein
VAKTTRTSPVAIFFFYHKSFHKTFFKILTSHANFIIFFLLFIYVAVDIVISSSVITLYFLFLKDYFRILKIKTKNKKYLRGKGHVNLLEEIFS